MDFTYKTDRISSKIKRVLEKEPTDLISIEELNWIKYVKKTLHSIWSLNDDGIIYLNKKNKKIRTDQQDQLVSFLVEDISSFSIPYEFETNAAYVWEIFRQVTVARINRDAGYLAFFAGKLEKIENYSLLSFNKHIRGLVIAAKVECYISIYLLIKQENTTENIVGYKVNYLFSEIVTSYDELMSYAHFLSRESNTPDYYTFPCNIHLIARVISLIENSFMEVNDEYDDDILEDIKNNFVYIPENRRKNEYLTKIGRQYMEKGFIDNIHENQHYSIGG